MKKFLTTAPVFAAIWFGVTALIMIEFNHFFPDLLFLPL
ncbi:Photosystem I reaction center subunit IX [Cyanobium sp. T1G-Tous]|jgi:photosystem I subunit IX|nr:MULTISPECIES: Photosystem I reaction center subunit IX [unclassified Cyanobium]MCP9777161.1 Photosystem I reaction center subunit IX [Cyanobium sp. Tous-M-B4]MCP9802461.1 Photosystem I reaction center subunit IX [Cyanobium sp. T1G-Tous]MCP9875950.1 Photosystem I reaction center subunit IX [Cyanobium sp. A2C-AMD]